LGAVKVTMQKFYRINGGTTQLKGVTPDIILPDTYSKIDIGEKTQFNYIDQSRLILNDEDTVVEAIGEGNNTINFGNRDINVFTYLRRFLFTDDRINTKVGRLSGGEKSRLTLANILKNGGNFLILDEPTNDLDLATLRILEEALISFEGCVIVVSHDRYFLNRVCNGILAFEENSSIHFSEGDYNYYVEKKRKRKKSSKEISSIEKNIVVAKSKATTRKLTWKEKKELETIEQNILEAEQKVSEIETVFSDPEFFQKYATQTKELNEKLEEAKNNVQNLYDRWEELEIINSAGN
jgi:ATP-binding cassette subfamily F protein uup